MSDIVLCRACAHEGPIDTFPPCLSPYQDIRCPNCGSTNNLHNEEYQKRLFAKMREDDNGGAAAPRGEGAQEAYERDLSIQENDDDDDS